KGALEALVPLCSKTQMAAGSVPMTPDAQQAYLNAQEDMAGRRLPVLAFAWRMLEDSHDAPGQEQDLNLAGLVGLEDPPRAEVPAAISKCRAAGIKVIMITGDHPHTAQAIGRQIGQIQTDNPIVITGEQLHRLSDIQLRLVLDAPDLIFARV